jgi:hypothetical protein
MYRVEKSTAEKPVDSREAPMWKSRVSVTIWHVRSRLGSLRLAVPPALTADNADLAEAGPGSLCIGVGVVRRATYDAAPSKEN